MRGMLLLLLATCFASVGQSSAATPARPNIVFFLVDDMGWQETSVPFHREPTELNRRYRTPNMEQLAAQGMKFTQAYASAVCSPTRVSALTGMTAARHRVTNWTLRRNRSPDDPRAVLQPPPWNVNGVTTLAGIEHALQVEATLASMIEGMDKSLGDLMATLERLGLADHTIILFMSDNGSPSQCPPNLPLRGHKLTPYEGGIRVPMIVKWPGVIAAGTSCDEPVIIEDVFPTLLDIAEVNWRGRTHQTVDGLSFIPLLNGTDRTPPDRPLLWHFPHTYSGQGPYSALRVGPWKLIHQQAPGRLELFNLKEDIGESRDLAASHPEKLAELAERLTARLQETRAQLPLDPATGKPVPLPAALVPTRKVSDPSNESPSKVPRSAIVDRLQWKGVAIEEPSHVLRIHLQPDDGPRVQ